MPNENGTQTIDADEKQTVALVDRETPGSPSKESPGKHSTPHRKRILVASAAVLVLFFKTRRSRRIARFTEQLPDALDVIVRGVRVGYPFPNALGLVAQEMKDPIDAIKFQGANASG